MSYERNFGHKSAIALGLLALVGMLNGTVGAEGSGPELSQWVGLIGAPLAFAVALLAARGNRDAFSVGGAFLGAVVAAPALHALLLFLGGASPSAGMLATSFGFGVGAALPYLLIAYGWKGAEVEEKSSVAEGEAVAGDAASEA